MGDMYVYNGTNKTLDLTVSIFDLMTQRNAVVPPFSQGHFQTSYQDDLDQTIAMLTRYGSAPAKAGVAPTAGVSHSTSAPVAAGAATPLVTIAAPARPPVPQPPVPPKK